MQISLLSLLSNSTELKKKTKKQKAKGKRQQKHQMLNIVHQYFLYNSVQMHENQVRSSNFQQQYCSLGYVRGASYGLAYVLHFVLPLRYKPR